MDNQKTFFHNNESNTKSPISYIGRPRNIYKIFRISSLYENIKNLRLSKRTVF